MISSHGRTVRSWKWERTAEMMNACDIDDIDDDEYDDYDDVETDMILII